MDPRRQQIEELLPFYALEALSDEERELVENYLNEHPEARLEVEGLRDAAAALPHGVVPVEPPRHVKEGLMARVTRDAAASGPASVPAARQPSRRLTVSENLFRVFSLVTAAVAITWVILLNIRVARLQTEIAALNDRLAAQSQSLQQIIDNLPQTSPSNVITVSLKGTEVEPQAQGQLIADPDSQSAVLVISGLPRLEAGKIYQVWLIDGGAPVSAGLLTVDENGQAVFIVSSDESISSFNSLGISIEPEGGSPHPTGEIVVLSDI